jgi:hypothetical protein
MSDLKAAPASGKSSVAGLLLRLFWMAAGTMALALIGVFIAQSTPWAFSWGDAAFWVIVALMATARYLDVSRFAGTTVNGERATMADFRRYAMVLPLIAACWWAAAHALALTDWLR